MNAALFQDPLASAAPQQIQGAVAHAPALIFAAPTGTIDAEVRPTIDRKARDFNTAAATKRPPSKPAPTAKDELAAELAAALTGAKPLKARR